MMKDCQAIGSNILQDDGPTQHALQVHQQVALYAAQHSEPRWDSARRGKECSDSEMDHNHHQTRVFERAETERVGLLTVTRAGCIAYGFEVYGWNLDRLQPGTLLWPRHSKPRRYVHELNANHEVKFLRSL
jgi:hypothetical protein